MQKENGIHIPDCNGCPGANGTECPPFSLISNRKIFDSIVVKSDGANGDQLYNLEEVDEVGRVFTFKAPGEQLTLTFCDLIRLARAGIIELIELIGLEKESDIPEAQ